MQNKPRFRKKILRNHPSREGIYREAPRRGASSDFSARRRKECRGGLD